MKAWFIILAIVVNLVEGYIKKVTLLKLVDIRITHHCERNATSRF